MFLPVTLIVFCTHIWGNRNFAYIQVLKAGDLGFSTGGFIDSFWRLKLLTHGTAIGRYLSITTSCASTIAGQQIGIKMEFRSWFEYERQK